jgi:hypothetical protein
VRAVSIRPEVVAQAKSSETKPSRRRAGKSI